MGGGTATFDGVTYIGGFNGLFLFSGPPIVVPTVFSDVTITSPFTFTGELRVCSGNCLINPIVFSVSGLTGAGRLFLDLTFLGSIQGVPIYNFRNITYVFEVPEPASILLFGVGLIGIATRFRQHRR